jgi:hypothetical protein
LSIHTYVFTFSSLHLFINSIYVGTYIHMLCWLKCEAIRLLFMVLATLAI